MKKPRWDYRRKKIEISGTAYNFTKKQHILSSDQENTPRDLSIEIASIQPLNSILEDKVGCRHRELERVRSPIAFEADLINPYRIDPNFSRLQSIFFRLVALGRVSLIMVNPCPQRNIAAILSRVKRLKQRKHTIRQIQQLGSGREHLRR